MTPEKDETQKFYLYQKI